MNIEHKAQQLAFRIVQYYQGGLGEYWEIW